MSSPVFFADINSTRYHRPNEKVCCAIVRPTITVERDSRGYIVSARFIFQTTVVEKETQRPRRKWHYLRSIKLRCNTDGSEVYLPESDVTPITKISQTESRGWQAGAGGIAGPSPGVTVNFSIVGNAAVTRDTQTGSWALTAFRDSDGSELKPRRVLQLLKHLLTIGSVHHNWIWLSKCQTLGYVPDDVRISMQRAITVMRIIPTAALDALRGPLAVFTFGAEVKLYRLHS